MWQELLRHRAERSWPLSWQLGVTSILAVAAGVGALLAEPGVPVVVLGINASAVLVSLIRANFSPPVALGAAGLFLLPFLLW
jgi:hypothetical protein